MRNWFTYSCDMKRRVRCRGQTAFKAIEAFPILHTKESSCDDAVRLSLEPTRHVVTWLVWRGVLMPCYGPLRRGGDSGSAVACWVPGSSKMSDEYASTLGPAGHGGSRPVLAAAGAEPVAGAPHLCKGLSLSYEAAAAIEKPEERKPRRSSGEYLASAGGSGSDDGVYTP